MRAVHAQSGQSMKKINACKKTSVSEWHRRLSTDDRTAWHDTQMPCDNMQIGILCMQSSHHNFTFKKGFIFIGARFMLMTDALEKCTCNCSFFLLRIVPIWFFSVLRFLCFLQAQQFTVEFHKSTCSD